MGYLQINNLCGIYQEYYFVRVTCNNRNALAEPGRKHCVSSIQQRSNHLDKEEYVLFQVKM